MKVSEFSVRHPVVVSMILIVLLVFGLYSLSGMVVEFMCDMSMPQANVITIYPGASAEDVEQDVSKVMEDAFVTLPHFRKVESNSYNSLSLITVTYSDGVDPYEQLEELRNRISELKEELPSGISGEPRALVGGATMLPVFTFTVDAGNDAGRVTEFVKKDLTPRLTRIDGVSEIQVDGKKELRVNIKLNTDALVAKGISITQVYQILNYANVNLPLGEALHQNRNIQMRYSGGFESLDDVRNLPVGVADGNTVIRMSDVAEVSLDYPESNYQVTNGSNPVVIVSITKRSDGNTVKIIDSIKKELDEVTAETDGAVKFTIVSDDSRQVRASMRTVISSGVMGIIFAVLVILLFMADWRATLAIGISIPLCVLFSFIGLKVCGITINLMSLSGLVISLGMVVDGSTVMIDQIYRYYRERNANTGQMIYTVSQCIYKGWDEVAASILASVATTLVVFIPIAMLSGLVGMILRPVAVTIIMAITASFFVAVIVVPYLLKLLLSDSGPRIRERPRKFDMMMERLEASYRKILQWAVSRKYSVLIFSVLLLVFSGFFALKLGVAFIPSTDSGDFFLHLDFPKGTPYEITERKTEAAKKILFDLVPEIDNVTFYVGRGSGTFIAMDRPESSYAHIILCPVARRSRSVHRIMLEVQKVLQDTIPDSKVSVENGGFDKLVGYASGGGGYGMTLISENLPLLYETASGIKEFLEKDSDVISVSLDSDYNTSTMVVDMSQEYLSSLGLTSYEAGITSLILFQGMDAGRFKDSSTGDRYGIRIFSDITDSDVSQDDIANIHIVTDRGQDVSFAALSDVRVEKSISQINHSNRAKAITVSAKLVSENTARVSAHVKDYLKENPLPSGIKTQNGGIMMLIGDMIAPVLAALIIAVFLVYAVMVVQFEKFRQPLLIMATIPFCFIGVVGGLMMFGSTLNLLALLGLISLAGVVVNNGIILVDYINQLRKNRREEIARRIGHQNRDGDWEVILSPEEEDELLASCVADGSSSRIKPILITTLTTLLGDIPMAVATGEGAELYAPMGQAIVGGLVTSTLITLILIPVLYYMSERREAEMREEISLRRIEKERKRAELIKKLNDAAKAARAEYEYDREVKAKERRLKYFAASGGEDKVHHGRWSFKNILNGISKNTGPETEEREYGSEDQDI